MSTKSYCTEATRIKQTLSERLEAIRQDRGTTKKALSLACARAPAYWSKMLSEGYVPSSDVVRAFCDFYQVDASLAKSLMDHQALSSQSQYYANLHADTTYLFSCSFCEASHASAVRPEGWRFKAYRLYCPAEPCRRKAYAMYKNEWQKRRRKEHAEQRAAGVQDLRRRRTGRDDGPWDASDWGYGTSHIRMETMDLTPMHEPYLPPMPARMWVRRYVG